MENFQFDYFTTTLAIRIHNSGQKDPYHIKLFSRNYFGYKRDIKDKYQLYNLNDGVKIYDFKFLSQFFIHGNSTQHTRERILSIKLVRKKKELILQFFTTSVKNFWQIYLERFSNKLATVLRKLSENGSYLLKNSEEETIQEGYLKKFKSKTEKVQKKYVKIYTTGVLVSYDIKQDPDSEIDCVEVDLLLCSAVEVDHSECENEYFMYQENHPLKRISKHRIKYDKNLRFAFMDSNRKRWEFLADNQQEKKDWIDAINLGIQSAIKREHESRRKLKRVSSVSETASITLPRMMSIREQPRRKDPMINEIIVDHILKLSGNDECADCRAKRPDWTSLNLGVVICIGCSGIHRKFGVRVSLIKSLKLDIFPQSHAFLISSTGNKRMNEFWYSRLGNYQLIQPEENSNFDLKMSHFEDKYMRKTFLRKITNQESLQKELNRSIEKRDVLHFYKVLVSSESPKSLELIIPEGMHVSEQKGYLKTFEWIDE